MKKVARAFNPLGRPPDRTPSWTLVRTTDIYFAAALSVLGGVPESIDKTDPRHMVFEFKPRSLSAPLPEGPSVDLEEIERRWANRDLPVNAPEYAEAIRRMKSLVHGSKSLISP